MSIEPSDAECGLLQLTPASLTVKSTFLFETGFYSASSVLCLVAAGVVWVSGFQASQVIQLSHPEYVSQWLMLLLQLLTTVDMMILVPVIYDISVKLHYGTAMSGLVLAARLALQPLGLLLGGLVTSQPYERQRRIVVASSWLLVVLTWSSAAVLKMSQHWEDATVMILLMASRALSGLILTFFCTPLEAIAFGQASMDNRATLSLWYFMFLGLGLSLGPTLCSTLLEIYKTNGTLVAGRNIVSLLGTLWSIYALLLTTCLPRFRQGEERRPGNEDREAADHARWEGVSEAKRESLVWAVVSFTAERSFTSSAIEVATSLILETQYGWKPHAIGFVMGAVFAGTVVMGCLALLVRGWLVSDRQLMLFLAIASTLASLWFVDWGSVGGPHSASHLLLADFVNFIGMFQLSAFMDGVAMQAAVPGSSCSLQNYIVLRKLVMYVARALAPPIVRLVIGAYGRNAYAGAQIAVTLTAVASVGFVAPFAKGAKGSELRTPE